MPDLAPPIDESVLIPAWALVNADSWLKHFRHRGRATQSANYGFTDLGFEPSHAPNHAWRIYILFTEKPGCSWRQVLAYAALPLGTIQSNWDACIMEKEAQVQPEV
ncbi:hypothetical protein PG985_016048 [Apiospora marii]|uniref:uncharacterized protein n=1 Tax=Apiospora marii TaxID=335849 RepID=UPI00312E42A3